MQKSLVIVESPAKAKTISKFLGRKYKVSASMGHVRDLPKSQLGVDVEKGFVPKYITIRGKGSIINRLKKEASKSDEVYLATDPDREGEAISWHLSNILKLDENKKNRIVFHEITKKAINEAIKSPRKIDKNLVDAQQARRILDRLVGYKISPLLWKKVKKGLSAGRVQSVAVRLISDREKEIENFIPEEYWTLDIELVDKESNKSINAKLIYKDDKKVNIKNKDEMDIIINCLQDKEFIVDKITKSQRKRNPAPPFTTSSLQQEAHRKLGFTAKKTMAIAQQLYEGLDIKGEGSVGLVTYIRTDSTRVAETAINECKNFILNNYGEHFVSNKNYNKHKSGNRIQDAHESIRPTSVYRTPDKIKESLTRDQYRLYKLIWERFLASQMSAAVYDTVTIDIKADNFLFRATGSVLKFTGFMEIYIESKDDEGDEDETKDAEAKLPELKEKQKLLLKNLFPEQHFTQPPPRFTEATLVKTLEEKGIGRPSTYAPIIDTIIQRGYVEKIDNRFKPTELGNLVVEIMKEYFSDIIDVDFTAEMENELDKIEIGEADWKQTLEKFYQSFIKDLKKAEEKLKKIKIEDEESDEICELCGRTMVIKYGRFGKFLACPGFPECKNTKPFFETIDVECPVCGGNIVKRYSKKGRVFFGCSNYPECNFMSWHQPTKEKCPVCGSVLVKRKSKKKGEYLKCINNECGYEKPVGVSH
ncbi:MAG: topoisomerase [Thermosediminibacterales bacterium]|nr:topoisomerase [Thermosediminibacterales bacterium]